MTKRAELDMTRDKSSWSTASPGEAIGGVTFCVVSKPGILKGRETVIFSDTHCVRPQGYMHCHKLNVQLRGWNMMGPIECKTMLNTVKTMVD